MPSKHNDLTYKKMMIPIFRDDHSRGKYLFVFISCTDAGKHFQFLGIFEEFWGLEARKRKKNLDFHENLGQRFKRIVIY